MSESHHRSACLYDFDREFLEENSVKAVAGVDEAGRGPLAGPVVAASVILDPQRPIEGINDSKKLKEKVREELFHLIARDALSWSTGSASVEEIDSYNILNATFLAMKRSLEGLKAAWDRVLVDGNLLISGLDPLQQTPVVGGDAKSASIAAASIMAKVTRDTIMRTYHTKYPEYGFSNNKGYGTALHIEQIGKCGLSPVHRRTFCDHFFVQTRLEL